VDPTARAYAILGLEKGCAPHHLKATYRRLVKRWHPDRFAADPAGQAEASARLREINGAFRIVAEDLGAIRTGGRVAPPATAESHPRPAERSPERAPGRPLTRDEIDAVVGTIGAESPVDAVLNWISYKGSFIVGGFLLLLQIDTWPRTIAPTIVALALLTPGIALRVRRWAQSRGEDRSG
jgi:DnaJ-like protein